MDSSWFKAFSILLLLLVAVGFLGSSKPLSEPEARSVLEEASRLLPRELNAKAIFINNLRAAVLMMIPALGLPIAFIISYKTGVVVSALGARVGVPGFLILTTVAAKPFFWLEFTAYSASATQSFFLALRLLRGGRGLRLELRRTFIIAGFATLLLLAGAFIELWFIRAMGLRPEAGW